jgi:hypothetical protein
MRRFAYVPKVEAYIRLDSPPPTGGAIVDITDDIISGSVTRRLNAMSTATLTLQNRKGKYTMEDSIKDGTPRVRFTPMDRIIIRMARIGQPFEVFSGYLDETPYFQLYPGTVSLSASCPLKLLANTYFDPGLPYMLDWFAKQGFNYDTYSGQLLDSAHTFGELDYLGGVAKVIRQTLVDIGGWPTDAINIVPIPDNFIDLMSKTLQQGVADDKEQADFAKEQLKKLFSIDMDSGAASSATGGTVTGNVNPNKIAQLAKAAGLTSTDALVNAVAHSLAESSGNSGAVLYDSNGTYDIGLWQINTVHVAGGGGGLPQAPSNNYAGIMKVIGQFPPAVQTYVKNLFNPTFNAAQMVAVSNHGTNFNNPNIWVAQPTATDYTIARAAVASLNSATANTQTTTAANTAVNNILGTGTTPSKAEKIVQVAVAEANAHIVEQGGDDRGPGIMKYLNYVGVPPGTDWCACFVSWVYGQAGVSTVKTAGVPQLYSYGARVTAPAPGDIVAWSERHTGIVVSVSGNTIDTVEGNTSGPGSTTGGVFRKPHTLGDGGASYIRVPGLGTAAGDLAGDGTTGQGVDVRNIAAIAQQTGWFQLQFQGNDPAASIMLQGKRAIANDVSLLEWMQTAITGSGRVFTTQPNGSFLAFYPDYFGYFSETPYFYVDDIEIIDLTINRNDKELTTHLFTVGAMAGPQESLQSVFNLINSKVASVEDPSFKTFINVNVDNPLTPQIEGDFNYVDFLKRYGARPLQYPLSDVRNPLILWMAGWMEFSRRWALQFDTHASVTFMPELLPGGLVELGGRITMFVNEVTHNFDRTSGFSTDAHLIAPAAKDRKRYKDLPVSGLSTNQTSSVKGSTVTN